MTEDALHDELTSINSIYGDDTFVLAHDTDRVCTLSIQDGASIVLRLQFPEDYPERPPQVLGTESVGSDAARGAGSHAVSLARDLLSRLFVTGEPCVFALLDELREQFQDQQETLNCPEEPSLKPSGSPEGSADQPHIAAPVWTVAPSVTEKKSIFSARVALVTSPNQATDYLQHYLSTDKKAAKASHNIVAWRIQGQHGTSFQDCDDDGETAAGGRLLHLMQLMDVWDAMVVVSRWYGGVHLGPDRFRIINNVAREALQLAGLSTDSKSGSR